MARFKLTPKKAKRLSPITKTDGEGRLWLVGYGRKPNSRKSGQEQWLKTPVRCEIREGKLHIVTDESVVEETLYHCGKCGWRNYAEHSGLAQQMHDKRCDEQGYQCSGSVCAVLEGEELEARKAPSVLPQLAEGQSNMKEAHLYEAPPESPDEDTEEPSLNDEEPSVAEAVERMETALKAAGWREGKQATWIDPRSGTAMNIVTAFQTVQDRNQESSESAEG